MNPCRPDARPLPEKVRERLFRSPWLAFGIFLLLAALARSGVEKQALPTTHDDHYFLLRSESYDMGGSHLAFIKEYPYAFFVQTARRLGFSLADFELLIYALALTALWRELGRAFRSYPVAWGAVLPLTVFPYVRIVLQRATYDNLQLILTPLVLAAAFLLLRRRADLPSLCAAGAIASLQWATRPDGLLFLLPLVWAIGWVGWQKWIEGSRKGTIRSLAVRWIGLLLIASILPAAFSLYNAGVYGFRAQTIMKSGPMDQTIGLMMAIDPGEETGGRYAPFPMASLEQALELSPALRRAEPFFRRNTGGVGWSNGSVPPFRPDDGSISGAHFQWAWLDASAEVAGSTMNEILDYQREVASELEEAFSDGHLVKRRVLTTAFGPNFSLLDPAYWRSSLRLLRIWLLVEPLPRPTRAYGTYDDLLDEDFNRLALRRTALVMPRTWSRRGWIIGLDPHEGPRNMELDSVALDEGVRFERINRLDVVRGALGLADPKPEEQKVGFRVATDIDRMGGNVRVSFSTREVLLPLTFLHSANINRAWGYEDLFIMLEAGSGGSLSRESRRHFNRLIAFDRGLTQVMRILIGSLPLLILILCLARVKGWGRGPSLPQIGFVLGLLLTLFGPFWALLSAIDAFMYPGNEPRYMAPAAFVLWFTATLSVSWMFQLVAGSRRRLKSSALGNDGEQ